VSVHLLDVAMCEDVAGYDKKDGDHGRSGVNESKNGELPNPWTLGGMVPAIRAWVMKVCPVENEDNERSDTSDAV